MDKVKELKKLLKLKPLFAEGGFFHETYRSEESVAAEALPARYKGPRAHSTAIYYLLTKDSASTMHRIHSDEVFHFYLGDPVEMLQLFPDGKGSVTVLGPDVIGGMSPQVVVKKGAWQGARVAKGGKFALLGTTVAPGFDFTDFESGKRSELLKDYPKYRELITALTK